MKFRLGTLISTLAVTFLFYAAMVGLIFRKIGSMVHVTTIGTTTTATAKHYSPEFLIGVNLAAGWLGFVIISKLRRRANRYRTGYCGGCGRRLPLDQLRCPLCGERRAGIGSTEPLFPVIMQGRSVREPVIPRARTEGPISR